MKQFYYQIKGRELSSYGGGWCWPPIFSGLVEADNKKKAKIIVEEEYERKFPLRVLRKDLENEHYLLNIREVPADDEKTLSLFELRECMECGTKFRVIDKYNDENESNKGADFCSRKCDRTYYDRTSYKTPTELDGNSTAVIYKIQNIKTGLVYIGKTTQVFTLRWYQHFYQNGECKFHKAIKQSSLADWQFSIIEIVKTPKDVSPVEHIRERESYWIAKHDSIENGYNSVAA